MFIRAELQALVDECVTLPHSVSVAAPFTFDIRPSGLADGPGYRVVVDRAAFQVRAAVVPDYLAVGVVAAVVAGVSNNPTRLRRLETALIAAGWLPSISLTTDGFRIEATKQQVLGMDDSDLARAGVDVAAKLSEFVLDQLVITQPIGEMRPAVSRPMAGDAIADVWMYDPAERDKATQVHRSLENWLIEKVLEANLMPLDPACEPFFDVAWELPNGLVVCEVKSTSGSEESQLRLGIGQVLGYRHLLRSVRTDHVAAALLVEARPTRDMWLELASELDIVLFWPDAWADVSDRLTGPQA